MAALAELSPFVFGVAISFSWIYFNAFTKRMLVVLVSALRVEVYLWQLQFATDKLSLMLFYYLLCCIHIYTTKGAAPARRSTLVASVFPILEAIINAVIPFLFVAFTSTPLSTIA